MKSDEADKLIATIRSLMEEPGEKKGRTTDDAGGILGRVSRPMVVGKKHSQLPGEPVQVGGELPESKPFEPIDGATGGGILSAANLEKIYRMFKDRLLAELPIDPILLHLMAVRPEILLEVERRIVKLDTGSLRGRVANVIASGFLDIARKPKAIQSEMERVGASVNNGNMVRAIGDLVADGLLTREEDGYKKAPGVKVTKTTIESGE